MSMRIDTRVRRAMAIIKSFQDIPTKFKHNDIFEQYANEIGKISAAEYAEILDTTRQNISLKFKNDSHLLLKEQTRLIEHLKNINATSSKLYQMLYVETRKECNESGNSNIPVRAEVSASCGTGRDVYDEDITYKLSLPNKLLDFFKANKHMTEIIYAKGDSMLPEINDNDMLLVDKSQTNIRNGYIYAFNYNGEMMCKQLNTSNDNIIAVSKNQNFTPFIIDKSLHFKIIGRVVGLFHSVQ